MAAHQGGYRSLVFRLWPVRLPAASEEDDFEAELAPQARLTLLTPGRTLRGHQESITCLEILTGTTGEGWQENRDRLQQFWKAASVAGMGWHALYTSLPPQSLHLSTVAAPPVVCSAA